MIFVEHYTHAGIYMDPMLRPKEILDNINKLQIFESNGIDIYRDDILRGRIFKLKLITL